MHRAQKRRKGKVLTQGPSTAYIGWKLWFVCTRVRLLICGFRYCGSKTNRWEFIFFLLWTWYYYLHSNLIFTGCCLIHFLCLNVNIRASVRVDVHIKSLKMDQISLILGAFYYFFYRYLSLKTRLLLPLSSPVNVVSFVIIFLMKCLGMKDACKRYVMDHKKGPKMTDCVIIKMKTKKKEKD